MSIKSKGIYGGSKPGHWVIPVNAVSHSGKGVWFSSSPIKAIPPVLLRKGKPIPRTVLVVTIKHVTTVVNFIFLVLPETL